MEYFQVRYDSRVVIYERKTFIRLATCLVVKGGDLLSEGHEFESCRRILDGHFVALICCKICIACLKRPQINEKEAEDGLFF